jgi:Na+/proline symporter
MKASKSVLIFISSLVVLIVGFLAVAVVLDMTSTEEAFDTAIKLGVAAGIFAVMAIVLAVLQRIGK